jgi:hypothetical protein
VHQPKQEARMTAVVFICPLTDLSVQHWLDEDEDVPENEHEVIVCPACTKVHLINRKTGKPLAQRENQASFVP